MRDIAPTIRGEYYFERSMRTHGSYPVSENTRAYCMFVLKNDNSRFTDINSMDFKSEQNYFDITSSEDNLCPST